MATITTNVRIYKHTHLTEEKHLAFDDVTDYLEAGTPEYIDVSEVKLEKRLFSQLEVDFKFALDASDLADFSKGAYDYLKVMFKPGESLYVKSVFYFFVKACEWKSTGVIALRCKLDVFATFPLKKAKDAIPGAMILKERTVTKRQHKDRFQSYDKVNLRAIRRIDRFDEGINPILYRSLNNRLYDIGEADIYGGYPQWNLIYRNAEGPETDYEKNPVECHFTLDEDSTVLLAAPTTDEITPAMLDSSVWYEYMIVFDAANDGMTLSIGSYTKTLTTFDNHYAIVKEADGTLSIYPVLFDNVNTWYKGTRLANGATIGVTGVNTATLEFYVTDLPYVGGVWPSTANFELVMADTTATLYGIHGNYVRTDPKLIKIVKVPYAPMTITYDDDNDRFEIPAGWSFDSSYNDLKLDDINVRFKRTLTLVGMSLNPWHRNLLVTWATAADLPAAGQARNPKYESKLRNSSFHMAKFVYDSFSVPIAFETVKEGITYANLGTANQVSCEYVVSSTFSGNFSFYFNACITLFDGATEDYPYRIAVARNNQEPIFNSAYLNYVRTGYNYDVKAKNNQLVGSAIGIASSVAGMGISAAAVAGGAVTAATGGLGLIGAGIGLIASLASTINAQMNSENQIQQKLQTARMQAVTISASDDVDLLVDYSGNRLKYVEYDPSPQISEALFDLFHYFGYACNDTGIPDIKSRYYFNYLQADADIEADGNVPAIFVEEAVARIAEGVTVIHKPLAQLGKYETTYENWETSILTA